MRPAVSIVMPVRNEERIVSRAIDSVINQTFSDWELVIVDDASSDLTPKILLEYKNKDSRIRVLRNNRCLGITKSINKGIRASMGIPKYLCYRTFRKHPKRRMLESTVNSIVTPLKYWRVLGRNVIYYPLLTRRIVTLIRILLSLY